MIEGLLSLDRSLFLFLNSLHQTWLNPLMTTLSGQLIWLPLIGYFFWFSYKTTPRKYFWLFVLFLLLTLIATDVTSSYILKNVFNRLRPCRELDLKPLIYSFGQKCGGKFGFVSSHAANSVALIFFSLRTLKFKSPVIHAAWIVPLSVGFSRIYLGVHYPGDILGGAIVGILWGWCFSKMYRSI